MGADRGRGRAGAGSGAREVVIPYRPRAVWLPYHQSEARWRVVVAHRRAGKTVAALNGLIRTALTCPRPNPRCAYVAPYLGQAKAVAWDHLKRFTAPIPGVSWKEAELSCDLPNGGRIRLFGADNPDALRGLYLDDVDCDEFGDWDPRAWSEVIRPALSDRQGRATFTGTPRGKNAFFELRERAARGEPGWALWELKASRTGLLSAEELADARAAMDASAYAREYECSFDASVEGAYYAAELAAAAEAGRVCRVPIEPLAKVDTWWDLGIDDATAIWFVQDVGPERRVVDYLEVSGEGLPQIVRRLEARDYRYGRHVLPHDAEARELGTGVSRVETLKALGLRDVEVVPAQTVADGINAVRLMLARCWFDAERCARGLEALKQYRREWDTAKLLQGFDYAPKAADAATIAVPAGFVTDFASVPWGFWNIEPPLGRSGRAAVVHDYLYATGGLDGRYNRAGADRIFREALGELGVAGWKRNLLWAAVRVAGGSGWGR